MKKLNVVAIISMLFALLSGNVYAENSTLTNQNIQGDWRLEYTTKSEKSEQKSKREDNWVFTEKGKVTIKHIPREGGYYDQFPVDYVIENDQLKIALLGRAGRFDTFTLVKIDSNKMILKARFGDIYHFIKK